jgi:hypothetical protein
MERQWEAAADGGYIYMGWLVMSRVTKEERHACKRTKKNA